MLLRDNIGKLLNDDLKQCAKWGRLQFPFSNKIPNAKKSLSRAVSDGQDIRDEFSRLILDSRAQNKFQFLWATYQQQGSSMKWPSSLQSRAVVFRNLQPSNVWEQINEANMQKISGKFHYSPISRKLFHFFKSVKWVNDCWGFGNFSDQRARWELELTFFETLKL